MKLAMTGNDGSPGGRLFRRRFSLWRSAARRADKARKRRMNGHSSMVVLVVPGH